jgi:hypothetical protein
MLSFSLSGQISSPQAHNIGTNRFIPRNFAPPGFGENIGHLV